MAYFALALLLFYSVSPLWSTKIISYLTSVLLLIFIGRVAVPFNTEFSIWWWYFAVALFAVSLVVSPHVQEIRSRKTAKI